MPKSDAEKQSDKKIANLLSRANELVMEKRNLISKSNKMAKGGDIEYKEGGDIEVVMDEGSGIVINKLFNEWNNIKNQKQHDKWVENVKGTKFGTYGTIGLLELLDKFNFKNSTKINIIVKNNFIKEVKSALTNYAEGGEVSSTKTIEPNSSDEFDEIIMANIDPHDDWIGNLVKERDIKQQNYKQQ